MGTWSDPFHDEATALAAEGLLQGPPVPVAEAPDRFYAVAGDDDFFDLLGELERDASRADARPALAVKLHGWMTDPPQWIAPVDPAAVAIVQRALDGWFERNPDHAAVVIAAAPAP
jgi:hypothetical protein